MTSSLYLSLAAIAVHSILFISIFDIYFTSPIESGMQPQSYPLPPPAKRLVLFVADGLRADTMFSLDSNGGSAAPFLRSIVENTGMWGVSHTHVPTESRPGHVALIAGFYEDVSAVTHGWQDNPVPFDSVFNRSEHTWSWGSPDILPMFSKGATPGRVDAYTYDAEWEDFADSDASKLDTWVFERVGEFFTRAKNDSLLADQLSRDKIVLFLHLLGIDTNGHSHRPTSKEVINNLRLVDRGIEKAVLMIESYFGDQKTAFVFTSDHGMTDWGSHGAGLPDETMVPLVCWGAGLKVATSAAYATVNYHDSYSVKWRLERYEREDVEQADIATLMSTLIGIPIPVNSEGVLPTDYIHYNRGFIANALFMNARQLLEQLRVKTQRIHSNSLPFTFRPFSKLSLQEASNYKLKIHNSIKVKDYEVAIDLSKELIVLVKEGVRYYHTYHRFSLMFVTTLSFLGWIGYVVCVILQQAIFATHPQGRKPFAYPVKTSTFVLLMYFLLAVQSSPILYYLYYTLAVLTWSYLWENRSLLMSAVQMARQNLAKTFQVTATFFLVLCGLELLVLSFFFREILTLLLLLLSLWPYFTQLLPDHLKLSLAWTGSCLILAIFPLLPVVGRSSNYPIVTASGLIALVCFIVCWKRWKHYILTPDSSDIHSKLITFQAVILGLASFVPILTNRFFVQKEAIPALINAFSWFSLLYSFISPFLGPRSLPGRLLHITLSFFTVFLLLSTSFEAIFVLVLCVCLYIWLLLEEELAGRHLRMGGFWESIISFRGPMVVTLFPNENFVSKSVISAHLIRQVAICLFLGVLSFFGIGNIASVNTFDPAAVYCFLTVFSPFVMGALILMKMVIPFVFVSCVYNAIMTLLGLSLKTSLLLMLIMTDVMGLNFFFLVRDSGSWLEIGISISHYVIMMVMCVGIVVLMGLARFLTGVNVVPRKLEEHVF